MFDVEFGRTAITYTVMEIKNAEQGESGAGFYFKQYKTETDELYATLFIPMHNQAAGVEYEIIGEPINDTTEARRNWD
jgi:hypothetical protein